MSGYYRTAYAQDFALLETRTQKAWFAFLSLALLAYPFGAGPLGLELANQVLLGCIGAVALMLLTGYAGQISLGHAGLLAAGAFTTGILFKEFGAPVCGSRCRLPQRSARCSASSSVCRACACAACTSRCRRSRSTSSSSFSG